MGLAVFLVVLSCVIVSSEKVSNLRGDFIVLDTQDGQNATISDSSQGNQTVTSSDDKGNSTSASEENAAQGGSKENNSTSGSNEGNDTQSGSSQNVSTSEGTGRDDQLNRTEDSNSSQNSSTGGNGESGQGTYEKSGDGFAVYYVIIDILIVAVSIAITAFFVYRNKKDIKSGGYVKMQ
jgi:hypothetical protein